MIRLNPPSLNALTTFSGLANQAAVRSSIGHGIRWQNLTFSSRRFFLLRAIVDSFIICVWIIHFFDEFFNIVNDTICRTDKATTRLVFSKHPRLDQIDHLFLPSLQRLNRLSTFCRGVVIAHGIFPSYRISRHTWFPSFSFPREQLTKLKHFLHLLCFFAPPFFPFSRAAAFVWARAFVCWLQYVRAWSLCGQVSQAVGSVDFRFVMGIPFCQ
jgi:hypothetical protein